MGRRRPGHALRGPRARRLTGAVRLVAVELRRGGPCTRCRLARCNGSTTPPHHPGSTYSLPPWRGEVGALVLPGRGACSRPSCQWARPYIRPMARTDGVVCEWVAAARATPSGDHALAASPARCNRSPSIFSEVGRALAATRRGATDRSPLLTTPGAHTRGLLGLMKFAPWCFPVAEHEVSY